MRWTWLKGLLDPRSDFRRIALALERLVALKEIEMRSVGLLESGEAWVGSVTYVDEEEMAIKEARLEEHYKRGGPPLPEGEMPFLV